MNCITTSWDDGHPLDFKLAERLTKYGLKATFYIPKRNAERQVMEENAVRELSQHFEVGGHTLNHVRLRGLDSHTVAEEVNGCYHWLADVTGHVPASFCFPGGAMDAQCRAAVLQSGFGLARTTELLSVEKDNYFLPTTLQLYPHNRFTYFKHLVKRRRWQSLTGWMMSHCAIDLARLTEHYLRQVQAKGGCLHLWGHSWEIEEYNLWPKLDTVFALLSAQKDLPVVENRELIQSSNRRLLST